MFSQDYLKNSNKNYLNNNNNPNIHLIKINFQVMKSL